MNVVIETDRLLLRTFTDDDTPLLYELNLDPEVTRRWAVHLRFGLEFIGWCGLKSMPETLPTGRQGNEINLGYRFMRKFWGKGYATEAAFACIQYGFTGLDLQQIIGRALTGNLASIKVFEKCGMKFLVEEYVHGYLHKTYQATNPAIKA